MLLVLLSSLVVFIGIIFAIVKGYVNEYTPKTILNNLIKIFQPSKKNTTQVNDNSTSSNNKTNTTTNNSSNNNISNNNTSNNSTSNSSSTKPTITSITSDINLNDTTSNNIQNISNIPIFEPMAPIPSGPISVGNNQYQSIVIETPEENISLIPRTTTSPQDYTGRYNMGVHILTPGIIVIDKNKITWAQESSTYNWDSSSQTMTGSVLAVKGREVNAGYLTYLIKVIDLNQLSMTLTDLDGKITEMRLLRQLLPGDFGVPDVDGSFTPSDAQNQSIPKIIFNKQAASVKFREFNYSYAYYPTLQTFAVTGSEVQNSFQFTMIDKNTINIDYLPYYGQNIQFSRDNPIPDSPFEIQCKASINDFSSKAENFRLMPPSQIASSFTDIKAWCNNGNNIMQSQCPNSLSPFQNQTFKSLCCKDPQNPDSCIYCIPNFKETKIHHINTTFKKLSIY